MRKLRHFLIGCMPGVSQNGKMYTKTTMLLIIPTSRAFSTKNVSYSFWHID